MLVLHYTGMETAEAALERLCDPDAQVSAHYLIDEAGAVYRLVDETKRAWHAGRAAWRGHSDVNGRSVGIELANPGHEFGYRDFPEPQIGALIDLAREIIGRHPIPARNVVGHSDVAPDRKLDPGERFDWPRLANAGIGLWPKPMTGTPGGDARALLADYGYDSTARHAIGAFQRHFRPARIDGVADEETLALLRGLIADAD
ncbi:MAG: N-acetylmuramoyl-L-alanine amidase [Alphaproteobacteria bacterium]|nr:N-acetylmuramoyl-L-alanine amidase [Alphaproteobacteria bacterium]